MDSRPLIGASLGLLALCLLAGGRSRLAMAARVFLAVWRVAASFAGRDEGARG